VLANSAARHREEVIEVVLGRAAAHPLLGALMEDWSLRVVHAAALDVALNQVIDLAAIVLAARVALGELGLRARLGLRPGSSSSLFSCALAARPYSSCWTRVIAAAA